MKLRHIVLTSVARDDLPDGGAGAFADTIRAVRAVLPDVSIEVLTSDLGGCPVSQAAVLEAAPDVYNHNVETVRRLQSVIRPQAAYGRSLGVLRRAAEATPRPVVKSGIMLGLGETEGEVEQAFCDLLAAGCELLTLGQYLQPTRHHVPVARYVTPAEFDGYAARARELGFVGVASGPMVRSSYRADELLHEARAARGCVPVA
jgi:lipoic acid synthetase